MRVNYEFSLPRIVATSLRNHNPQCLILAIQLHQTFQNKCIILLHLMHHLPILWSIPSRNFHGLRNTTNQSINRVRSLSQFSANIAHTTILYWRLLLTWHITPNQNLRLTPVSFYIPISKKQFLQLDYSALIIIYFIYLSYKNGSKLMYYFLTYHSLELSAPKPSDVKRKSVSDMKSMFENTGIRII